MSDSRETGVYLAIVFAVSYAAEFFILAHGGIEGPAMARFAPLVMWIPGVTALILLFATGEGLGQIAWKLPRPAYLAWGILVPALGAALSFVAIIGLGLGASPHVPKLSGTVQVARGTFVLGRGEQSLPFFVVNFLVTAVVLSLVTSLVTAGEEIGWRGFLQPRLVGRFGKVVGLVLVGFIWAHWHTPLILHGFNYPEAPRLGAWVLWPLTCIFFSFLLGWLSINGESVWPAVVAHACWNSIDGGLVMGIAYPTPEAHRRGDLVSLAIWAIVGTACLALTKTPREPGTPPAGAAAP